MPINLQRKNLTQFPTFESGETQLLLSHNFISTIPPHIDSAPNLTHLYLDTNKIKEIPIQIGKLKKLDILILANNEISSLPIQIGELTNLSQLRLQGNKLTELPKEIGNLKKLTHLFLEKNQISSLPEEIKNLTNLVHLSLSGNMIPLPENYSPSSPKETIAYILEQQNIQSNNSLITNKAYYFTNTSHGVVSSKYINLLDNFTKDKSVDFIPITSTEEIQKKDTNLLFIIAPIDSNDNENLIIEIAKKCKAQGIRFFILAQEKFIEMDFESVNLSKWDVFKRTTLALQNEFFSEYKTYSSNEDFESLIFEALKQHKPDIRLTKLILENIGHFSNFEMTFDKDITCLIGENGTGKSTILRALALAIIGPDHKKFEDRTKRSFMKIQEFSDNNIVYKNGLIQLEYTIDGDPFVNELKFIANDNGNDIIISSGDSQIVYNKYTLKSLIIGFPQTRGNDHLDDSGFIQNKLKQPHVNDLLPLLNNSDDARLRSFTGWVANLYFDSLNSKDNNNKEKEIFLIEQAFKIISQITKKEIAFKTVTKIDPPDVWVTTYDAPNGIPLNLISQGFKIVIGWIGYLLQRFINTFPLTDPKSAFKEKAIVIIDEVDISMHPLWQLSFIEILKETFPNTQFIFTTHDPLLIGSLSKNQVRVFNEENGIINVIQPETDPKGLGVAGILTSELFGLRSTLDENTLSVLKRRNELITKQDEEKLSPEEAIELNDIFHKLNSLGINTTDRDPLYQKFIIALSQRDEFRKEKYTAMELKDQNEIALSILNEIINEQKTGE